MKIKYRGFNFAAKTRAMIDQANAIIEEYAEQGLDLTLRQLYYQFVSRDLIPNRNSEYKRLGSIIADARLAGLIDWNAITDRTRNLRGRAHWSSPKEIVEACASQFAYDRWAGQQYRPEVFVEKDALIGVIEQACLPLDVPFFSCRGYVSISEVWGAAQRFRAYIQRGQEPVIFHLGDHDPSGIDMTRDLRERLLAFDVDVDVRRIALNMDQVRRYNPPPNPAKDTDSRFESYQSAYGDRSWELDALDPTTLVNLIRASVASVRDDALWSEDDGRERADRERLATVASRWDEIARYLSATGGTA